MAASAQCVMQWVPGEGVPGVSDGTQFSSGVLATTWWDPDGQGPRLPVLVVAGAFDVAGAVAANNIAAYDPVTGAWSTLATGVGYEVRALATLPNGDLVAGGLFTSAGGVAVNAIARWDGASWSALGAGLTTSGLGLLDAWVNALQVLPNGDLVAGGRFTTAGSVLASNIARWDGSSWSPLGAGMDFDVLALAALPNGDLIAGGSFTAAGAVAANGIARWDGANWSTLGAGVAGPVTALASLPNGDVVAGGNFATAGSVSVDNIARWDGTNWSALGIGFDGYVGALRALAGGDIVVGGRSFADASARVRRWNGASWSPLGAAFGDYLPDVTALAVMPNGDIVAGGRFSSAGPVSASNIARWTGTTWSALAPGLDFFVNTLAALPNGEVLAAGSAEGAASPRIARWNGASTPFGIGFGPGSHLHALLPLPNGDVVAAGSFVMAGAAVVHNIARWDGTTWSALGTGVDGPVQALARLANGDIVAGGNFWTAGGVAAPHLARWNGSNWSALPASGNSGFVTALTTLPNGDLVVGFGTQPFVGGTGNAVARWDGANWSTMGGGPIGLARRLAAMPNGDVVVSGSFPGAGSVGWFDAVLRWDGTSWSTLLAGANVVANALLPLPNGDLLVGGEVFVPGVLMDSIARWNGTNWSGLGAADGEVLALALLPNGDVVAGGGFLKANGLVSAGVARLSTTCPASAVSSAIGCPSSGGANLLSATHLPWLGSTFRAQGTGLPALALVGVVTGFTTLSLPLSSLLPQGKAGCNLAVSPDAVDFAAAILGTATSQLTLPNTPALVNAVFHQQMIAFELDSAAQLTEITATNALSLTVGSF